MMSNFKCKHQAAGGYDNVEGYPTEKCLFNDARSPHYPNKADMISASVGVKEEGEGGWRREQWVKIAWERADWRETDRIEWKYWRRFCQGIPWKKETWWARSRRNFSEFGWISIGLHNEGQERDTICNRKNLILVNFEVASSWSSATFSRVCWYDGDSNKKWAMIVRSIENSQIRPENMTVLKAGERSVRIVAVQLICEYYLEHNQ